MKDEFFYLTSTYKVIPTIRIVEKTGRVIVVPLSLIFPTSCEISSLRSSNHRQKFQAFAKESAAKYERSDSPESRHRAEFKISDVSRPRRKPSSILINNRRDSVPKLIIAADSLGLHYVKRVKLELRPERPTRWLKISRVVPSFVREIFNDVGKLLTRLTNNGLVCRSFSENRFVERRLPSTSTGKTFSKDLERLAFLLIRFRENKSNLLGNSVIFTLGNSVIFLETLEIVRDTKAK